MWHPRARFGSLIAGATVAGALAACSFVTSLSGLTGGAGESPDSSAGDDATTERGDGSARSPPGDDGGTADDGAPGANDDASDAALPFDATPFCATQPATLAFCDDFDQDDGGALAVPGTWDQITSVNGAATVSMAEFLSRPSSMQVATVGGVSSYDCSAYRSFAKYAAKPYLFTFSFEIYVAQVDTTDTSGAVLSAFQIFNAAGARYDLQLEVTYASGDGGGALAVNFSEDSHLTDGGAPYVDHVSIARLPLATWTPVTLALELEEPAGGTLGNSAKWTLGKSSMTYAPNITVADGTPEILVGVTYVTPLNTAWTIYYDNVTFAAEAL